MKKLYSLFTFMLITLQISAQTIEVYESFVVLNINNGGNSYYTLKGNSTNPWFTNRNLGTFTNTQSVVVVGAENGVLKCNGGDAGGGSLFYKVFPKFQAVPGPYAEITPMTWVSNSDGVCGTNSNEKWSVLTGTTNILSGLSSGDYELEVFTVSTGGASGANSYYVTAPEINFRASFTIDNSLAIRSENQNSKIAVVDGKLYVSKTGSLKVAVYELSGKLLKTMVVNSVGSPIDLGMEQKGMYIVKVSNGTSTEVVKFVK